MGSHGLQLHVAAQACNYHPQSLRCMNSTSCQSSAACYYSSARSYTARLKPSAKQHVLAFVVQRGTSTIPMTRLVSCDSWDRPSWARFLALCILHGQRLHSMVG